MSRLSPALFAALFALPSATRAANPPQAGNVQFDGARAHAGSTAEAPSSGAASSPQDAQLFEALMQRVQIRPDSDPRAAGAIRDAFTAMLKTKTGGELARAFVAENAHATVGFGKIEGSAVVEENGIKVMNGSGGFTQTNETPPAVTLNGDYLDTDADYRRVEIARVLTHEMMGHGFERQRVLAAGLSPEALNFYRADEGNASMVGWLVQAELGGKLINSHMWNYLSSPEKFYKGIELLDAYYATTLSPQQMLDPMPVWRDRLDRIPDRRASLLEIEKDEARWKTIIRHFIDAHGFPESSFKNLNADIDYTLATYLPAARAQLDETEKHLKETIENASSPKGAKLLAGMRTAGQSEYVRGLEARMNGYAGRLRTDVGDKKPETAAPPDPLSITWDQLARMWSEDAPAHKAGIK